MTRREIVAALRRLSMPSPPPELLVQCMQTIPGLKRDQDRFASGPDRASSAMWPGCCYGRSLS